MGEAIWRDISAINSGAVLPWTRVWLNRCDPYLVWADATTKPRKMGPEDDEPMVPVLVELCDGESVARFIERMNGEVGSPTHQIRFVPNGFEFAGSRFANGVVSASGLERLIRAVVDANVVRFTVQESRRVITDQLARNYLLALELQRRQVAQQPELERRPEEQSSGTYLGVIDDGLPFLRVRSSIGWHGKTAHLWDQGWLRPDRLSSDKPVAGPEPAAVDLYWQSPWDNVFFFLIDPPIPIAIPGRGFLYGRRLKELPQQAGLQPMSDRDEYAVSGYFYPVPRRTHGAAVLGLLAPWLSGARGKVDWPEWISGLAMVQLPTLTVYDTSGGSLATHVLDAIRYVVWQESVDRGRPNQARPTVVNVSYGVHAGPHNGTSMFECALKEVLDANPQLHVVLPVGNAHVVGGHAHHVLGRAGTKKESVQMHFSVLPDNVSDTFVEIWLPEDAQVSVSICPPGSSDVLTLTPGEAKVYYEPKAKDQATPGVVQFAAIYPDRVAQGNVGTMVLIAIGATQSRLRDDKLVGLNQRRRRRVQAPPGTWTIGLKNLIHEKISIDAWIERDDAPPDSWAGSRQAFFPDSCEENLRTGNASPEDTLNGIATLVHERLHVVGAMRTDGRLSRYSAAGPGRPLASREGPDVVVPADWSNALPGLRTTGFSMGAVTRLNGTSAACAVYSRALAESLAKNAGKPPSGPTPADIPPEITCVPDHQPEAEPKRRGQRHRMLLPFDVDL